MSPRVIGVVVLVGLLVGGAIAVASGQNDDSSEVAIGEGSVFLASDGRGEVVHADAASAEIDARIRIAPAGTDLRVTQAENHVVVLDQASGELVSIDPTTFDVTRGPTVEDPDEARVLAGDGRVYLLDGAAGVVKSLDPQSLEPDGRVRLTEGEMHGAVSSDGTLFVIDPESSDLVTIDHDEITDRQPVEGQSERLRVTLVGDQVQVVNVRTGAVTTAEGVKVPLGADPGGVVIPSAPTAEAGLLWSVLPDRGVVVSFDTEALEFTDEIEVGEPGHDYGPPVLVDDTLYVPDFSLGSVALVDTVALEVRDTAQVRAGAGRFELVVEGPFVVFNDPDGARSGVIARDGSVSEMDKFDPDVARFGDFTPPPPTTPQGPGPTVAPPVNPGGGDQGGTGGDTGGGGGPVQTLPPATSPPNTPPPTPPPPTTNTTASPPCTATLGC